MFFFVFFFVFFLFCQSQQKMAKKKKKTKRKQVPVGGGGGGGRAHVEDHEIQSEGLELFCGCSFFGFFGLIVVVFCFLLIVLIQFFSLCEQFNVFN